MKRKKNTVLEPLAIVLVKSKSKYTAIYSFVTKTATSYKDQKQPFIFSKKVLTLIFNPTSLVD